MNPRESTCFQQGQEFAPELVGLAVPDGGAQHFAGAVDGHPGGHHQGLGDHVGPDLFVQAGADA